jgi:hypothetical protein
MEQATKQDVQNGISELKQWILEREVATIRWSLALLVGMQVAFFVVTLGAMYFMLQHVALVAAHG